MKIIAILLIFTAYLTADIKMYSKYLGTELPNKYGTKVALPWYVQDVKLGAYGVFAIAKFPHQRLLGVFNMSKFKFEKFLTLKSSNFIYAAGARMLVVYYPDFKVVEIWDLLTLKKISTGQVKLATGHITAIEMGSKVNSKAFVSFARFEDRSNKMCYGFLDLKTLKVSELKLSDLPDRVHNQSYFCVRVNNDLSKAIIYSTYSSKIIDFKNGGIKGNGGRAVYTFANNGYILSSEGEMLNKEGDKLHQVKEHTFFPVEGADQYIEYNWTMFYTSKKKPGRIPFYVKNISDHSEIAEYFSPIFFQEVKKKTSKTLAMDRHILASAHSRRILLINNIHKDFYVYPMGKAASGPPAAKVSEKWSYNLNLPTGTKVVIESGPDGLIFNTSTGSLEWPSPDSAGTKEVLFSITKPGKDEYYKELKILVE